MRTLVIGGAASGKSAVAERLCLERGDRHVYLATMPDDGSPEARAKIERHEGLRAGKGFELLEATHVGEFAKVPAGASVLLEGLGTLCATELFDSSEQTSRTSRAGETSAALHVGATGDKPHDQGEPCWHEVASAAFRHIEGAICVLERDCADLVVVTDDLGRDGVAYDDDGTAAYLNLLARLNRTLGERFERVVEVVFGIEIMLKGGRVGA